MINKIFLILFFFFLSSSVFALDEWIDRNDIIGEITECGEVYDLKNSTKVKWIESLHKDTAEGVLSISKSEVFLKNGLIEKKIRDVGESYTVINCEYDEKNNVVKITKSVNLTTITHSYVYNEKSHLESATKIVDVNGEKSETSTKYKLIYDNNDKIIAVSKIEDDKIKPILQRIYFENALISQKNFSYYSMEDSLYEKIYDNGRIIEYNYYAKFHTEDIQYEDYKLINNRLYSVENKAVTEFYNGEINTKEYYNTPITYGEEGWVSNKDKYKYEEYKDGKVEYTITYDNQDNVSKTIKYDKYNIPYCEKIIKTEKNQQRKYLESTIKLLRQGNENKIDLDDFMFGCSPGKGIEIEEFDEFGNQIKWSWTYYKNDIVVSDTETISKYYY